MLTHDELKARALADPQVRAEYERLNREELARLDEVLAALVEADLDEIPIAERVGAKG